MIKKISFLLLLLIGFFVSAQTAQDTTAIRVGITGSAPFYIQNEKPEGIVPDLWREIAFSLNRQYQYTKFDSVKEGMQATANGDIDVLVGPITINSRRAETVSFSQPFFDTQLAILAPVLDLSFWDHIKPFFSSTFLYAVCLLLIILSIVGTLFYLLEGRKFPDEYGDHPIKGIGIGVWLAIVTMTTVGYGDFAPKTPRGRFVMGAWMVISLIMATSFVAGIATTLTVSSQQEKTIKNLGQLEGKKVATPSYDKVLNQVRNVGGSPVPVTNVNEAYQLLKDEQVDAVLYDEVPLEYVFKNEDKEEFILSKKNIQPQHYGFIFPLKSDLRRAVDLQILQLREDNTISDIITQWINSKE
ncbi:transporter substrate-binding domain-containing protein [Marixanthomonas spongiae]|uniref:Amino acid ABC transporter substrate-binding protein n=1 Tax=Marixanthomonas spongiae TaxID=2174845 RepID=A0A2U0I8G3_9FLAO|nr:transporter substrate-binding domain-containing protein [Marixanthomonas spongiae]PVW17389.1 amino acid ABC transporter substrate-binding protein [Marixanthomonas spongiae]